MPYIKSFTHKELGGCFQEAANWLHGSSQERVSVMGLALDEWLEDEGEDYEPMLTLFYIDGRVPDDPVRARQYELIHRREYWGSGAK